MNAQNTWRLGVGSSVYLVVLSAGAVAASMVKSLPVEVPVLGISLTIATMILVAPWRRPPSVPAKRVPPKQSAAS